MIAGSWLKSYDATHCLPVGLPRSNMPTLADWWNEIAAAEFRLRAGGGDAAIDRQHQKGRLTARERIAHLLDADSPALELGLWVAHGMYAEYGGAPAAGVVTTIGRIAGRRHMVVANDATVKAGAFFPATAKK